MASSSKGGRKPSKTWRVYGQRATHAEEFRSKDSAYEWVRRLTLGGSMATVYHYDRGEFRLYARIKP